MQLAKNKRVKWGLVLVGLALIVFFGARARESYRQLQYLHERGFDTGDAEVNAIRPWMTIDFVAAAYAVPEDYIFAKLELPADQREGDVDLENLNRVLRLGPSADGQGPEVIHRLRAIILAYRANPVATGLAEVRGWMTLSYVANSAGIPTATLTAGLMQELKGDASPRGPGAPSATPAAADIHLHQPLDQMAAELRYPGGPPRLFADLEAVITRHAQDKQ